MKAIRTSMKQQMVVVLATWMYAWGLVLLEPARAAQTTITFSLASAGQYSTSVGSLRKEAQGSTTNTCQGLPMLSGADKYVLVQFTGTNPITVTIHLKTLYVEGYSDTYQGKCRPFITDDASSGAGGSLCGGSGAAAKKLGFKGTYSSLLGASGSGLTREAFQLGVERLRERMGVVAGKASPGKRAQAQLLLTVVQMVPEAARFTYIEREVRKWADFYPNKKMTSLEDEWGKISTAVGMADKDGNIPAQYQPKDLLNESGGSWMVTKVSDIRGDIGLLNKVSCNYRGVKLFVPDGDLLLASYSYIVENNVI